jgi:hypothetical protein
MIWAGHVAHIRSEKHKIIVEEFAFTGLHGVRPTSQETDLFIITA